VLGNPPYNGFAGVSPAEEDGLLLPYKEGLKKWGITKNYLNDLYVRFFRVAERRIAEITGRGVVCYISNFSYLGDPSFVVMRKRFLEEFDTLRFDCLNGDSRETGKLTPHGASDPSVFSTAGNPEGIRVGTSISLLVRATDRKRSARVTFRHLWGRNKRSDLVQSLDAADFDSLYEDANPSESNRYSFRPLHASKAYYRWPSLAQLAEVAPMLGLNENRGEALHDISREKIAERMKAYYDPAVPLDALGELHPGLTTNAASFDANITRTRLLHESTYQDANIRRFIFKPFDLRWAYVERKGSLWNRVRPDLIKHASQPNQFVLTRRNVPKFPDGSTLFACRHLADQHALHTDAYFIPIRLVTSSPQQGRGNAKQLAFSGAAPEVSTNNSKPNLSLDARAYLAKLGVDEPDVDLEAAELVWMHVLAAGYSSDYLRENADGIRQDWPRIPLPNTNVLLLKSASLGRQIAQALDPEYPVAGVTTGSLRSELKELGSPARSGGGQLKDADLALTAGWGHLGQADITMPGQGKLTERDYRKEEREAISKGAKDLNLSANQMFAILGAKTLDIYLNDVAYWSNVPAKVWEYTIGGYQVIKKWLSYREEKLLDRPLTKDEVRYVQEIVRRIAAILLLTPALETNYQAVKADTFPWPAK
jgi:Type ISP C-terminal specificity domain